MIPRPFGFRVVGHKAGRRTLVDWRTAFAAYARCDELARTQREAYLSHFVFGADFGDHVNREGSEKGYTGPCACRLAFLGHRPGRRPVHRPVRSQTARRCDSRSISRTRRRRPAHFPERGKGVHIGLPTIWHPEPSPHFNVVAKLFCLDLAERAKLVIDSLIYSKTRLFRAPNSRHPKSRLFKRRLSLDELTHLKPEAIVDLARHPEPFRIPSGPAICLSAADDWEKARRVVERQAERQRPPRDGNVEMTAFLRRFIRDGELEPDRRARLDVPSRGRTGRALRDARLRRPGSCPARRCRPRLRAEPERSEATDRLRPGSWPPTEGRRCDMSTARYQSTADLLDPWRDDVLSGQAADPLCGRHRRACENRDRAGTGHSRWRGTGAGKDRLDDATGRRCPCSLAGPEGAGLQRRDEPADPARPPACATRPKST